MDKNLSFESKKDIILDTTQHAPIETLRHILEVILNNEPREKIKEFPDGCRINLEMLQNTTIEDIYNIINKNY